MTSLIHGRCLHHFLFSLLLLPSFAVTFGLAISANDALSSVMSVHLLGPEKANSGISVNLFGQGLAVVAGPPLLGECRLKRRERIGVHSRSERRTSSTAKALCSLNLALRSLPLLSWQCAPATSKSPEDGLIS